MTAAPIKTFSDTGIQVAIWEGNKGLNATIKKTFKKEGQWKTTTVYFLQDLDRLIELCNKAKEFMKENDVARPEVVKAESSNMNQDDGSFDVDSIL